jgi:uncharacterized membrane protein YhaH (DUF805 family)
MNVNLGNLLFSFQGRINRAKFWLAIVIYLVASLILSTLGLVLGPDSLALSLLNMVIGIASLISGIAVGIKRLHDRNRSGWLLLVFYIVPGVLLTVALVLGFYGMASDSPGSVGAAVILGLVGVAIGIWAVIELGCLRGTIGSNRYGPDPLLVPVAAPAPL